MTSRITVVGIGASAGGIQAFEAFFRSMPANSGMAFVILLHLPADRKSMLREILARRTPMNVVDAQDGTLIAPDSVFIPPPHTLVSLADGRLRVSSPLTCEERTFLPIDTFFDSLAACLKDAAVGIVLSGTGSDGALGLKAIKEAGGLTVAQGSDGTAPQYPEMPEGAIAMGSVDLVASVEDIPGHLLRMMSYTDHASKKPEASETDACRLEICAILRSRLGHDFSGYRSATFLRRVERRMQVVGATTLSDYVAKLKSIPIEATLLFRDLLIRVTSFFRDPEIFEVLEQKVIPALFEDKGADGAVRV